MAQTRVVVSVRGGIVQQVYSSDSETEVIVVDWDSEGYVPGDRGVACVSKPDGNARLAHVSMHTTEPLETIAGTNDDAAIQYARAHKFPKFDGQKGRRRNG